MKKKGRQKAGGSGIKMSQSESMLREGIAIHKAHPLFGQLNDNFVCTDQERLGKKNVAIVTSYGQIYLNKDYSLRPAQWANVIAHCQLHLAFGHFDAEKMPGHAIRDKEGNLTGRTGCDSELWNMACDIYVTKFLQDIKYGQGIGAAADALPGSKKDELQIYEYLTEHREQFTQQLWGTASLETMDMEGLEHPRIYGKGKMNYYAERFARALSRAAVKALQKAGNVTRNEFATEDEDALWFINHYPLLGALAASFRIEKDYQTCISLDVQVAAISVQEKTIYLNPAAGLSAEERRFVIAHEFLHAGLMHGERCQGRDAYLWNVACDYVINGWLQEMEIGQMPECVLYDETLKNRSAESIYDEIITEMKKYRKLQTFRGYGKGDVIDRGGWSGDGGYGGRSDVGRGVSVDDFCRNALAQGLEVHINQNRGYLPCGLVEEIRALAVPPVPWDVELAKWFEEQFPDMEKHRSYARPSRRQASTPEIPRPSYVLQEHDESQRTFGVVIDTSGSMEPKLLGMALGAVASYAAAREVKYVRVVFCDAAAYDAGYLAPEELTGRVQVKGRGGTELQPGVDLLNRAKDFPKKGPILLITDGYIEDKMNIHNEHAFLIPKGNRLPFRARGKVFYFE